MFEVIPILTCQALLCNVLSEIEIHFKEVKINHYIGRSRKFKSNNNNNTVVSCAHLKGKLCAEVKRQEKYVSHLFNADINNIEHISSYS